ncbi:MAG TPA: WD40 repeat domain-containing protein, partial [Arcobacter sp.]|nr:WD40 repeat domain-containing protein [Arcobacter sp.]
HTSGSHWKSVKSITISPDGKTLVSGYDDNTIRVWDIQSGEEKRTYYVDKHFDIPMMDISPDGKLLVHAMDWQKIKILKMKNGKLVRNINTDTGWSSLIISSDGKIIISSSADTIKLWNIESGKKIKTLSQYNYDKSLLAITPDGKIIVSRDGNGAIILCDIVSEKKIKTFQGHTDRIRSIAITPDSKTIVFRFDDYIKLFDIKSEEELKTLYGHTGMIESIAITPDGKTIVSGSRDRTIKLWDIESGEELATFVSFGKDSWASITSDGYYNSSDSGLQYIKFVDKDGSFLPKEHEIYEQRKRKPLIKLRAYNE